MEPTALANIIMNVSLISIFIAVFFFSYGSYISKQIIESQVKYLVDDIAGDTDLFFTNEISKKKFGNELKKFIKKKTEGKSDADLAAEKNNSALLKKSAIVLGSILLFGINTVWFMSKKYGFDFWNLLKYNLIILAAAGSTEFVFLTCFAKNYRIADRNKVKFDILESIKNNLD